MRHVSMYLALALVFIALAIMAAVPAFAAPHMGITPTPTPGGPPSPAEIPEPMTLALVGAGVAGLIGYMRHRR